MKEDLGIEPMHRGKPLEACLNWCRTFLVNHGFVNRRHGNKRSCPLDLMAISIAKFMKFQICKVFKTHDVPLRGRLNIDQVPACVDLQSNYSWVAVEDARQGNIQVSSCGPSGTKRFLTAQLAICADKTLPPFPLVLIFRGAVTSRFLEKEKPKYHPRVKVFTQPKGWVDSENAPRIFEEAVHPWIDQNFLRENCEPGNERSSYEKWVLYIDNLGAQRTQEFVSKIQVKNRQCVYGPANRTDGWQPIDRVHIGANLKHLAREKLGIWFDRPFTDANGQHKQKGDGTNMMNWEWFESSMKAEDKRILMTWILGDAWDDLMKRPAVHESSFAKGGCLAGISPSSVVEIVGLKRAFVCAATRDTEWDDEDYFNKNFTGSPNFEYKVIKKHIVAAPVAAPEIVN